MKKLLFTDINNFKKDLLEELSSQITNTFRSGNLSGILQEHIAFLWDISSVNNNKNQDNIYGNVDSTYVTKNESNNLTKKSNDNNNNAKNKSNNKSNKKQNNKSDSNSNNSNISRNMSRRKDTVLPIKSNVAEKHKII